MDFKPLSKTSPDPSEPVAPTTDQEAENKPKPAVQLQPILESSNSLDSGVGLTPDGVKRDPPFANK